MNKGPLIRVKHPDGHETKMYQADAIAAGLVPGAKARPPAENKMLPPAEGNKADMSADMTPNGQPDPQLDDFTSIEGVGLGTARSLAARGIKTFAQLREARDLSFLSKKVAAAIEAWRAA